jgi:hypothetical protein
MVPLQYRFFRFVITFDETAIIVDAPAYNTPSVGYVVLLRAAVMK